MKIFTIGFTQKSAQEFFDILRENNIQLLIDIRLKPHGQLSGFAKGEDLPYFLDKLADRCQYSHLPELAPTNDLLSDYRVTHDWPGYVARFEALLDERDIPKSLNRELFEKFSCCLLCSEHSPEKCHRRLIAERLAANWADFEIVHL